MTAEVPYDDKKRYRFNSSHSAETEFVVHAHHDRHPREGRTKPLRKAPSAIRTGRPSV